MNFRTSEMATDAVPLIIGVVHKQVLNMLQTFVRDGYKTKTALVGYSGCAYGKKGRQK